MRSMEDTFWLLEVGDCLNIHVHIEWSLEVEDGPMCGRLDQTDHNMCILLAREDGVTDIQMIHAGVKNLGCFIQHIAGYREEDCQNLHAGVLYPKICPHIFQENSNL